MMTPSRLSSDEQVTNNASLIAITFDHADDIDNAQARANAALIAAAPDLLEALTDLVDAIEKDMGASAITLRVETAQDAIKKSKDIE